MSRRNGGWTSGRAKRCLFCAALVRSVCFSAKLIAAAREGPGRGRRQGIAVRQRQTATFVCWRLRHPAALQPPGAPCDDGGSAVGPGLTSSSAAHLRWHTVIIYRWDSLLSTVLRSALRPPSASARCVDGGSARARSSCRPRLSPCASPMAPPCSSGLCPRRLHLQYAVVPPQSFVVQAQLPRESRPTAGRLSLSDVLPPLWPFVCWHGPAF